MFLEELKSQLNQKQPLFIGEETALRSAIAIPLVQVNGEWHILFEVRALTMRRQPGDISFPGGKIDARDASPMAAALRETHEELGVEIEDMQVCASLSPYIASPTFVVYPFVIHLKASDVMRNYNREEVEEVFTIPIDWLLNHEPYMHSVTVQPKPPANFPFDKIVNGSEYVWRAYKMEEWFYEYQGYTIWGLTARILKHFINQLQK